jgi:hypothetical protein
LKIDERQCHVTFAHFPSLSVSYSGMALLCFIFLSKWNFNPGFSQVKNLTIIPLDDLFICLQYSK